MKVVKGIDQLIVYLEKTKNIINITQEEKKLIYSIGYINIITPYKHYFHKGKDINGNHIYDGNNTISDYLKLYVEDKEETKKIREIIYDYEKLLKSQINEEISQLYIGLNIDNVKLLIQEVINVNIIKFKKFLEEQKGNEKLIYKIKNYEELLDYFKSEKSYYLLISQANLSQIKTIIDIFKFKSPEIKFYSENFRVIRIMRNSLSHGDTIQMHLNRLNNKEFKKTISSIKAINRYNFYTSEINFLMLNKSYEKYNQ